MNSKEKQKNRIEHIIWDWNGTLIDDSRICVDVMNKMLSDRSFPVVDISGFAEAMDFPIILLFKNLGFDLIKEKFEDVIEEFLDGYEKRVFESSVRPEFVSIIKAFYERGISMSIVSASHDEYLQRAVRRYGLNNYFKCVSGLPDKNGVSKVEIGKRQIVELGINKKSCLMIGDTAHDFEVACDIGVRCWLFPSGHSRYKKLKLTGANVFTSSSDLAESLKQLLI